MRERSRFEREVNDLDLREYDQAQPSAKRGPAVSSLRMRRVEGVSKQPAVRARILWPALGFPAVIAPQTRPSASPTLEGDATRCITVLLLSNKKLLSKAEAARHLRYVAWPERGRRQIPAGDHVGSFKEEELTVRNDEQYKLTLPAPAGCEKDARRCYGQLIAFGGNKDGENGVTVNLAHYVRDFYRKQEIQFLHEIRVHEDASSRLQGDLYHLFWNNEVPGEDVPSDEMALLMKEFARPRRQKEVGENWEALRTYLLEEYEYEYGSIHLPYTSKRSVKARTEILHPLFVERGKFPTLRIGHLTDTHVDVRADVYEENLIQAGVNVRYNNWNTSFTELYKSARQDSDVILLTGDLIDYGRGHWGLTPKDRLGKDSYYLDSRNRLGEDGAYHLDRNWFLFYDLLASGNSYEQPVYTILGNHDWRVNPYPPFAIAGAPGPGTMLHDAARYNGDRQKEILRKAHGPGYDPKLSYAPLAETALGKQTGRTALQLLGTLFLGRKTLDLAKFPTETTVESVAWYLMAINPFLDYSFKHPAGHRILMLDWAEDENVQFGSIYQGKRYHSIGEDAAMEGPTARNCLTDLQRWMVESFTKAPGVAKIIGIHAPPISPWDDWYDNELALGWKSFDMGGRGYPHYAATQNGKKIKGHPLFAIRPAKGVVPDAVHGMDARFNSFERHREWLIKHLAEPRHGVRLVLAGHTHRKGMYVAYKATDAQGPAVAGETLIKAVLEKDVRGVRHPAGSLRTVGGSSTGRKQTPGPLYVIGTSGGPRGKANPAKPVQGSVGPGYAHAELASDGTIGRVDFRWLSTAVSVKQTQAISKANTGRK